MSNYFRIGAIILVFAAVCQIRPADAQGSSMTPAQKTEIEKLIGDYIRSNPEIVLEAIQTLRDREKNARLDSDRNIIRQNRQALYQDATAPIAGNPRGDVTVVEFFDYACAYCKRVFPAVRKLIGEDKNIRIVYKEFPILGPVSRFAAIAALAAKRQGLYREFHESLMAAKGALTNKRVLKIAEKAGLNRSKLVADMESRKAKFSKIIEKNIQLAASLKISGTPGFVIGDTVIRGALNYESLKSIVKSTRAGAR